MSVTSVHKYQKEFIDQAEQMRRFLIDYYKKRNISWVRKIDYVVDTFFKVAQDE